MRDNPELSPREEKILNHIITQIKKKGYPPTVRELCESLNIRSTSTVHKEIEKLEQKGCLRKDPAKPRAIEILSPDFHGEGAEPESRIKDGDSSSYAAESSVRPASSLPEEPHTDVIEIPVVGSVAAGQPILAEQNIDDSFPVPSRFVGTGEHFMLRVKGESMIDAGIHDGDYILVRRQESAKNGDMVVAMVDGFESEATVKTFYREKDHIRLQPENSTMSPIIVNDARVLGLVKGVFRFLM